MVEELDFDDILARNPHIGREAVERAKAIQRALNEQRKQQPKRRGLLPGIPRSTSSDDPANDPRVTRLPRSAQVR